MQPNNASLIDSTHLVSILRGLVHLMLPESSTPGFNAFRTWLYDRGGGFHPHVTSSQTSSGLAVMAKDGLAKDTIIVTCPFQLIITRSTAENALKTVLGRQIPSNWSTRQCISSYICFHWILGENISPAILMHHSYLATLPSRHRLRTPLYFTPEELQLFRGTNLYGAALDKEQEWKAEWSQCRNWIQEVNSPWGQAFTWDFYLTAATYLSSRAFPSSLLSQFPTLKSSPSTEPVLIPGIDALNHARGESVSWSVMYPDGSLEERPKRPCIALIHHNPLTSGQEIFNNYGIKPNSELILGYGFTLPQNPEDTIVLKIGGIPGDQKWEVGRNAANVEGLWDEIMKTISDPDYEEYDNILESASMLRDMVRTQLDRLPQLPASDQDRLPDGVRSEVTTMLSHYLEGQQAILEGIMQYANAKEQEAIILAGSQGVELLLVDE